MCRQVICTRTNACCGFNYRGLSEDRACPPTFRGSTSRVLRCTEQKSVPVLDQEVLAHEGTQLLMTTCLPRSLGRHARCNQTAATFISSFQTFLKCLVCFLSSTDLDTFMLSGEVFKPFLLQLFFFFSWCPVNSTVRI